jgi:acyl-ACP thioesterase
MRPTFERSFRIRSYEIDAQGRLDVPVLCRLLQEAATEHAAELGVAVDLLIETGVAWVLTGLDLTMERWPSAGDTLLVRTWPEAMDRLTTERRFEIADANRTTVGTATTLWLILDLERRRPIRIPKTVADRLAAHDLGSRPRRPGGVRALDRTDGSVDFAVRRSDLDVAGHVNNTTFVGWLVEAVPTEVWRQRELAELTVSYRSECHLGDVVESRYQVEANDSGRELSHQLVRTADAVDVARARTLWREPLC